MDGVEAEWIVLRRWFLGWRFAGGGAGLYLLVFLCAAFYPVFDRRTFSGIAAVLLALPWIDYLPNAWPSLFVAAAFNAIAIYALLAALSLAPPLLRRLLRSD